MRESRTSGSVGAGGGQPPSATRPHSLPGHKSLMLAISPMDGAANGANHLAEPAAKRKAVGELAQRAV